MGTRTGETTPLGEAAGFDGGLVAIADRTWAWLQPNGGLGESNAGLVIGDGAALLVDTLWDERLTAAMLEAVVPACERAGAPLAHLFNTHGDGDHWYGNGLVPSEAEIVATFRLLALVKAQLDARWRPDGYNVGWNCGAVGGQTVMHAHLHVIPRFAQEPLAGQGIRAWLKSDANRWEPARGGRCVAVGWWTARGSNPRPPRCERGALPTELAAQLDKPRL